MKQHYERMISKENMKLRFYSGIINIDSYINRIWDYRKFRYRLKDGYAWYYRHPKTLNEKRQNSACQDDGFHVRGKRRAKHPNGSWDAIPVKRTYGKSWKDYTKYRKQWMIGINYV